MFHNYRDSAIKLNREHTAKSCKNVAENSRRVVVNLPLLWSDPVGPSAAARPEPGMGESGCDLEGDILIGVLCDCIPVNAQGAQWDCRCISLNAQRLSSYESPHPH